MRNHRVKIIGLTGGIGSGKTTATNALRGAGYTVIDADEISRALFARGTDGEKALCALFPQAADESGALDRRLLRDLVSRDEWLRQKLNAATHPAIAASVRAHIAAADSPVILSAPLLFESGLNALCDVTVCISCPERERIARIVNRDGITENEACAIVAAQLSDDEREKASDMVISSSGDAENFTRRVLHTFSNLLDE